MQNEIFEGPLFSLRWDQSNDEALENKLTIINLVSLEGVDVDYKCWYWIEWGYLQVLKVFISHFKKNKIQPNIL